jgi:hypothetical protein
MLTARDAVADERVAGHDHPERREAGAKHFGVDAADAVADRVADGVVRHHGLAIAEQGDARIRGPLDVVAQDAVPDAFAGGLLIDFDAVGFRVLQAGVRDLAVGRVVDLDVVGAARALRDDVRDADACEELPTNTAHQKSASNQQ